MESLLSSALPQTTPTVPDALLTPPAPSVSILSVAVSALSLDEAVDRTLAALVGGERGYVAVTGVHGIMEAQRDPELLRILNQALLCVPDGMPTVWVGRLYGHQTMSRVYGPDFMLTLCDRGRSSGLRHFFYGGNPGVAEQLRVTLTRRLPGLQVVGTCTPPFRPLSEQETVALAGQLAEADPDILWVGLSTPKQERFMAAMLPKLPVKLMVGVGAAFDIHTGRIADAPAWVKRAGLQWLHRLAQEPRRLGRRYLLNNPLFVVRICRQLLRDLFAGQLRPSGRALRRSPN